MNKTQMSYWFLLTIFSLVILVGLRFAYNYAHGFTIANITMERRKSTVSCNGIC
jgi:hypothetical protein